MNDVHIEDETTKIETLTQQLQKAQNQVADLNSLIENYKKGKEEDGQQVVKLQNELRDEQSQIKDLKKNIEEITKLLQQKKHEEQRNIDYLQKDLKNVKTEIETLKKKLQEMRDNSNKEQGDAKISKLEKELYDANEKIGSLKKELENNKHSVEQEMGKLKTKIIDKNAKLKDAEMQIVVKTIEWMDLSNRNASLHMMLRNAHDENEKLNNEINELVAHNASQKAASDEIIQKLKLEPPSPPSRVERVKERKDRKPVINAHTYMLKTELKADETRQLKIFDALSWTYIKDKEYEMQRTRKLDKVIEKHEKKKYKMLFPINSNKNRTLRFPPNHWTLLALDIPRKKWTFYNSNLQRTEQQEDDYIEDAKLVVRYVETKMREKSVIPSFVLDFLFTGRIYL